MVVKGWQPGEVEGPVAGFCGLGNPGAFWQTLDELGIEPVLRREYGDHHRYTAKELRKLTQEARKRGAAALVTTEKDLWNLPVGWGDFMRPLAVHWVQIGMEVEGAEELMGRMRDEFFM
jgi:tetraacyldisaccharide 4'-kinase